MNKVKNPLLELQFDEVVMYDYTPTGGGFKSLIVNDSFELVPDETIKKSVQLDDLTAQKLTHLLGNRESYGEDIMRCFIPHLAFIYFNKKEIVFHVSVCLTCNNLASSVDIPAHREGRGLSRVFRDFLNALLDENNFSNNVRLD